MIRLATAFSGIGAVEQALKQLEIDHKIVFACDNGERYLKQTYEELKEYIKAQQAENKELTAREIISDIYDKTGKENYVKKTYMANYDIDEESWYEDVRFLDGTKYVNKVDLFVGGSPCQSFSIMGKRKGLEEARGTLFYEYARLVSEIKPKVFIYENVTGMLNHDKGHTWEVISKIFNELGYKWTYWILNAKDFGLPHNRRRIFVVGFRKDFRRSFRNLIEPQGVKLQCCLEDFLDRDIPNRYYLPEKGFKRVIDPKQIKHVSLNGKIARCQVACQQYNWFGDMRFETKVPKRIEIDERVYKGMYNGIRGVARCLTPRECLRLMGYDDEFKLVVPDMQLYRQSGNSIAVNVMKEVFNSIQITGVFEEKNDEK